MHGPITIRYTNHVYVLSLLAKLSARDLPSTHLAAHNPWLIQCVLDLALCAADTEVPPWNSGTVNIMVYRIDTSHEYAVRYCNISGVDNFTWITHRTDKLWWAFPCYVWYSDVSSSGVGFALVYWTDVKHFWVDRFEDYVSLLMIIGKV